MNRQKMIMVLFAVLFSITPLFGQAGISLETPRIYSGNVVNDSIFSGPIAIESFYSGEEPFMGLDKRAYYTVNALADVPAWSPAALQEKNNEYDFPLVSGTQSVDSSCAKGFGDGRMIVVWKTVNTAGYQSIHFQLFDAMGNCTGNEVQANRYTNIRRISASVPDIAFLANGNFVVAWDGMDNTSTSQYRVYGRRFKGDGTPLDAAEFELSHDITFSDNLHPSVMATEEYIITVWASRSAALNTTTIEAFRYDYDGFALGERAVLIQQNTNRYFLYPQITKLNEQEYILLWGQVSEGLFIQKMLLVNNTLQLTGTPVVITRESPVQKSLEVKTLAGNGFIVTWSQLSGTGVRLFGHHFNNNCESLGASFQIDNYSDNTNSSFPQVSASGDGGFLVCWRDYNFQQKRGAVMIKRYTAGMGLAYQSVIKEKNTEITAFSACATGIKTLLTVWADKISSSVFQRKGTFYPAGKRMYTPGTITPQGNIDIRFKLVDTEIPPNEWISPVRSYLNADSGQGANSTIVYPTGFTNQRQVQVQILLEDGSYSALHFYRQTAPVLNGQTGSFGAWEELTEGVSTQRKVLDVDLSEGYAYRFRYEITNIVGTTFNITSDNILVCDRTGPEIRITNEQLAGMRLTLTLETEDGVSGMAGINYRLNKGAPVSVTGNTFSLELEEGANHLVLEAADRAGNISTRHVFRTAENVLPSVRLTGITEGGEYGTSLVFGYSSTVPLTSPVVYIDNTYFAAADTGVIHADLTGFPEGNHRIAVRGMTSTGTWLEGAVNIRLKYGVFSLVLLSPQEGQQYGTRRIAVEYWAGEPLEEVWYSLDGNVRQENLELTSLANGNHVLTLYALNRSGNQVSANAAFSVNEIFPELNVISPAEGQVFPDKEIELVFETNSAVSYELREDQGNVVTGTALTVEEDGEYTLILTAIHPVSGNTTRESINFSVDSVEPELTIITPEARLYGNKDINVDYRVNKAVQEVTLFLDDEPVKDLSNLETGIHRFEVHITDYAGRRIEKGVDFTVAILEILSPAEGARIVSESQPPAFDFVYAQEGNFDSLTRALDNQEGELILDPPGREIPLTTEAGKHELNLRGYLDEFTIARRNRFQIGRKNLTVKTGSIDYTYGGTGISGDYNVNISLHIYNTGDVDVDEDIQVRFDYINQAGVLDTFWETLAGLKSKEEAEIPLGSLVARFGDHFLVTLDPEHNLSGEYQGDNSYGIEFQTGQITGIATQLPDDNIYLQYVSVFNTMEVETAGAIASVELHTNSKVFFDNTPENGFRSIVDMGLLSPERNYVRVLAYGSNGVLLDSRKYFLNIRKLPDTMGGHYFPWSYIAYASSGDYDRINISNVDLEELTTLQAQALVNSSAKPPCILPMFNEDKSLQYKIVSLEYGFYHPGGMEIAENMPAGEVLSGSEDNAPALSVSRAGALSSGRSTEGIDMGNVPGIGGVREIPNGKGYMHLTSFDAKSIVCTNEGSIPLNTDEALQFYNDLIRRQGDNILAEVTDLIVDGLDLEKVLEDAMREVYKSVYDALSFPVFSYIIGSVEGMSVNDKDLFDISVSETKVTGEIAYKSAECSICNTLVDRITEYDLELVSTHSGQFTGAVTLTMNPNKKIKYNGGVKFHLLFMPIGYVPPLTITFLPQNIIKSFMFSSGATMVNYNGFFLFNPVHTVFRESVNHNEDLLDGDTEGYALFGNAGVRYDGDIKIKSDFKADIVYTPMPDLTTLRDPYVRFYGNGDLWVKVRYQTKSCFFGCWWNDWHTIYDKHESDSRGANYSDEDVQNYIRDTLADFTAGGPGGGGVED